MENMPVFRNISSAKRTGENGLPGIEWRQSTGLSLRGHSQSGSSDSVGRIQCDHKPTMRRKRLDLVKHLGDPVLIAALMLRTDAPVSELPEEKKAPVGAPGHGMGGDMD